MIIRAAKSLEVGNVYRLNDMHIPTQYKVTGEVTKHGKDLVRVPTDKGIQYLPEKEACYLQKK